MADGSREEMDSHTSLLSQRDSIVAIKEGSVAVRGHFIWRDRYVVINHGAVTVRRRKGGSIKIKIDLLDRNVKLTFHDDQSLITISSHGKDTVFDCRTTSVRDEWLGAIVSAQGHLGLEYESSGFVFSGNESDDSMESRSRTTTTVDLDLEVDVMVEDDSDTYNEVLLALQNARDSMLQCNLSMAEAVEDLFEAPRLLALIEKPQRRPNDEEIRLSNLQTVCTLIEDTIYGGRVILLHLGILSSAGIELDDILLTLGEKQRSNSRRSSSTGSQNKQFVAKFVRDMLFHPVYCKRPEVSARSVQDIIDKFFPHCRLRRFSDDVEHVQERNSTAISSPSCHQPEEIATDKLSTSTTADRAFDRNKKRRHHSFPNIFSLTHLAKTSGILTSASVNGSRSAVQDGGEIIPASALPAYLTSQENRSSNTDSRKSESSDLAEAAVDENPPLEPLRSLLWELSCADLAAQLTQFHHDQLARICLWDFLYSPRQAAKELSEHFNRLVSYFVWSVLVEDTPKERAEVIEDIISIALTASAPPLNNFHLVMACVGCLGDTPLMGSRLPVTWKKVRAKYKSHLAELRRLCDHTGGFENLRKRQCQESAKSTLAPASSHSCFVPFIGVVGVALERLRLANYFTTKKTLNLEKLERQYQTLSVLETAILKPPPPCRSRGGSGGSANGTLDKPVSSTTGTHTTLYVQAFFRSLNMAFATPKVLQLRSQQILGIESSSGSRVATANYQSSVSMSNGAVASSPPLSGTSTVSLNSLGSAISSGDDLGSPFLSFRHICDLLITISDPRQRVDAALEALFLDDRQSATRFLRKFWLDLKQNMHVRSTVPTVQGIRSCVATLHRDLLLFKATELMQLSGLDDMSEQLQQIVYTKLVALVMQPVYAWLLAKAKQTVAAEESRLVVSLQEQCEARQVLNTGSQHQLARSAGHSSPIDLLELLVQLARQSHQPGALASKQGDREDNRFEDDEAAADAVLLSAVQGLHSHFLACHPLSSVWLLQQLLDRSYLSREATTAIDTLDRALKRLQSLPAVPQTECQSP